MEIVATIFCTVVHSLVDPVTKNMGYVISCTKYVRDMRTKMMELDATRLDVEDHIQRNKRSNFKIPSHVTSWLEKVEKIKAEVENVHNDEVDRCFNLKIRDTTGRKAFKIIQDIDRLIIENSRIKWTDHLVPLGNVDSERAYNSSPSSYHVDFKSRERIFMDALKALEPDQKSHMIAICGMGGIGKTTMMGKLKSVMDEKKYFSLIVKVVIGEKTNLVAIQDAVADYLSIHLSEKTKAARADRLRKSFEAYSDGGKNKILIILDDVWQFVDLNDIGLSPFPSQGVCFKVLLTARDRNVCTMMGVEVDSILNLEVIKPQEAQSFFRLFVEISEDADPELYKIGDDIVRRCGGLPIAIKTIAYTLKGKTKDVWKDAFSRLEHHDIDGIVHQVIEMSYNNLNNEETKSVLLLCGLFPNNFDIHVEDLMRYGWGLKLFKRVYTIREARHRLKTCVGRLIRSSLLIESHRVGCVKLHDLVLSFVLGVYDKVKHTLIVNHHNMFDWPRKGTGDSYERISLTCIGMSEFPRDFVYPNLKLLKLMHGDESLVFSHNLYEKTENLEVISYEKLHYPLFPRSLQCSTNLRTLCLRQCILMFDYSPIGYLLNLEVLSLAHCNIRKLPSTIGNLKVLKLLDLTGCVDLRIDDGILKKLVKLEELYMRVSDQKAIQFVTPRKKAESRCTENTVSEIQRLHQHK